MKVSVLGSGAGALSTAADFAKAGHSTTITDLPQFSANLEPVREIGGIRVASGWDNDRVYPVAVEPDAASALVDAELVVVVVPCYGHEANVERVTPVIEDGQALLFMGEGGGSILARRSLNGAGKEGVLVGETNTLPYLTRVVAPASVTVNRKAGGVLLSAVPSSDTGNLRNLIAGRFPQAEPAQSVWETILTNFNAVDHVPAMVANVGVLESRTGAMLLWGEGATPSVVRLIEAVDEEYLALRASLGLRDRRRYRDFLVAQGMAPAGLELFETLRASRLMASTITTGPDALNSRHLTEDVPYALVLAASIGDEVGVDTPIIDSLIWLTSRMLGTDFWASGRALDALGLSGIGVEGLCSFAETGEVDGRHTTPSAFSER